MGLRRQHGFRVALFAAIMVFATPLVYSLGEQEAGRDARSQEHPSEQGGEDGAESGERTSLEVGYMPILPVAQLFVLEGAGWAEEAGLDLNLTRFSDGPAMVQAVASGRLDVMYFGIGPAMVSRARGQDIQVVAAAIVEQIALIADETLAGYFEEHDGAEAFSAFREEQGRPAQIATFPAGSVPHTTLRYWTDVVLGIPEGLIDVTTMGSDQVQQALLTGNVDGSSILEPILTIVQERSPGMRVVARAEEMFPGQPGAVLAVRRRLVEEHPDAVRTLVDLHARATAHLSQDIEQSAEYISEFIGSGIVELSTLERALRSPSTNYTADPEAIVEPAQRMHDFQLEIGSLDQSVDVRELINADFFYEVR